MDMETAPPPGPPPAPVPAPVPVPPLPPFGAGKAFLSLGLFLLAQIVVGVGVVIVAMAIKPGIQDPMKDPALVTMLILTGGLASAGGVAGAARLWAWPLVLDRTPSGLGVFIPRRRELLLWASIGVALGLAYLAVAILVPSGADSGGGPLAQAAGRGGWSRLVWAAMALLVAPPSEELLFRGLLLKGFASSWGAAWASVVVTVIFAALHLTETLHYWPATLFILGMAVTALVARLRTGSVVASMAFHVAYNGVIVAAVYLLPNR